MEELVKNKNYDVRYDLLNICACISVVILHVNGSLWNFSLENHWYVSMMVETIFYWAVPVFFMLSGATLLDYRKRYSTRVFFEKRFRKTVIPFLFWSVVAIFWAVFISKYISIDKISSIRGIINTVLNAEAMSIYWFFPALFSIYLCIPVLSAIPEKMRKNIYLYLIIYSFISSSIFPLLGPLFGIYVNANLINPLNGGGFVMFVLIGYYITRYPIKIKNRILIYLFGIFGIVTRYFYTILNSRKLGVFDKTMFGYSYFPSVLLSVAVFTLFWYTDWSFIHEKAGRIIKRIASDSFGVYLVHFYIMRALVDYFDIPMESYLWKFGGTFIVYFMSLLVVEVFKKNTLLRKIIA